VKQNIAAHDCPHGEPCRYRLGDDGMPVDWNSPQCDNCTQQRLKLHPVNDDMGLTDKAWDVLDDDGAASGN
jgi:hypothetical protein